MMAEIEPEIEEEVHRYANLLKQVIRTAGLSVSEVERRLGAGPKALRRIFSGDVDLKLKHILAILRILNVAQEDFFALAARQKRTAPRTQSGAAELLALIHGVGFRGDFGPVDEPELHSNEELDRLVEEAVNRVLERRRLEGKPPPEPRSDDGKKS
jgi:transcriptional regulator with XRE-family HTH domain